MRLNVAMNSFHHKGFDLGLFYMDIFTKIRSLNFPLNKYVIVSGGSLHAHGIRNTEDIDVLVSQDLFESLKSQADWEPKFLKDGKEILVKDIFEVGYSFNLDGKYEPDPAYLISSASIIKGLPFMKLEEVLKFKKAFGREKDLKDVELIEKFLSSKHGTPSSI